MWSLKFKVRNVDSIYTHLTEKYNVVDYLYPADRFKKDKAILIFGIHILHGEDSEQKKFITALKKNPQVQEFEAYEDRIIALIREEEKFYDLLYDPELYLPAPVLIEKGYETWHLAAWNREKLSSVLQEMEKWKTKLLDFKLLSFEKSNLREIYFPIIYPILPEKQKNAYDLALKEGYYSFPRKIDLQGLAKKSGVSAQTFHENLRRAEEKLIPFFSGKQPQ